MNTDHPRYRILYIDDEESNLRVFKNTFRREFEITLANSASEALQLIDKQDVDVVITDQRMPGMTGVELLRELKKKKPSIPPSRLMLSGYAAPADVDDAYNRYELFQFISKPWEENELRNTILKAIQNR